MNQKNNQCEERKKAIALLAHVPWLRYSHLNLLISEFGEPEAIVITDTSKLRSFDKLGEVLRAELVGAIDNLDIERVFKKLHELKIHVVTILDEQYPDRLKEIGNPPIALFMKGNVELLDSLSIAIVGSRKATRYGLTMSERIASDLAELGITVVSGMALGIDSAAHNGALSVKGRTIAVLGCGVDIVYPFEHKELYDRILEDCLIVSEYPAQSEPKAAHFPERNRIISGLSHAVVVVEAPRKSGALITASTALDQGREIFAVPGLVTNPTSRGCHHLIKNGQATLAESADDILTGLKISKQALLFGDSSLNDQLNNSDSAVTGITIINSNESELTGYCKTEENENNISEERSNTSATRGYTKLAVDPLERKVIEAVSYEGTHINELARSTGLTIANLSAILTMLEIKGVVTTSSGGYYQRI